MKRSVLFFLLLFLGSVYTAEAGFVGGLGYIRPAEYRVANKINPLPFGLSVFPMIAYRGERLNVLGPNISYSLIKGLFSFGLRINATGDRYEADNISTRDTAINGGFFARFLFLTINWGHDLSNRYGGHTTNVSLGWRFRLTEKLFFNPSVSQSLLSRAYSDYYYGVRPEEAVSFNAYQVSKSQNTIARMGLVFALNERHSIALNYSHRFFDRSIYKSPTVSKKSHGTLSVFWNYKI